MTGEQGRAPPYLALGPVLFNWTADRWRDFYFRIADEAPVDVVYVGEVVCSKRAPFHEPLLPDVIERLERGGKQVVLSTLGLIAETRERRQAAELVAEADRLIEANDLGLVAQLAGRPHVIGPFINVYNEGTLRFLAQRGAARVCLPFELSGAAIGVLAQTMPGLEIEVQVFGRVPLALSVRCYHARAHGLRKDGCQFVCEQDPDGMTVKTLDGEPFLAINGTQTLSHSVCQLLEQCGGLRDLGVSGFRLSPHAVDMVAVAALYRAVIEGRADALAATEALGRIADFAPVSNGFYFAQEGHRRIAPERRSSETRRLQWHERG